MARTRRPGTQDDHIGRDAIAAALKQMHDQVASEEIPDDFLRLLDEIDSKIAAKMVTN